LATLKEKGCSEETEVLSAAEGQEMPDCRGKRIRQWNIKEYSKY